jgi:hypothetical protein
MPEAATLPVTSATANRIAANPLPATGGGAPARPNAASFASAGPVSACHSAARGIAAGLVTLGLAVASSHPAQADSSTVTSAGVTLHSVTVELPFGDRQFPDAPGADLASSNCLGCHSAGMVLTQPSLSPSAWQAEVAKMRSAYKAPIAAEDVPGIVAYLAQIKGTK